MVFVKGGSFEMGSTERECEVPIHRVTVPDFYICKYPVTQKLWKQVTQQGNNQTSFPGNHDRPVEFMGWEGTQEFIQKLNAQTGRHYRLPSEAEWEYAARGGNKSQGFKYAGSDDMEEVGWCNENASDITQPVGKKKPNELGLFDMSGNVWEWCEDIWHEDYQGAPTDGSAWKTGGNENQRVIRGGSWCTNSEGCLTTLRNLGSGNNTERGFRLAHEYPM